MTWTRRSFIKASGLAAGAMVLDLTLPMATMSSGESTLPEEDTIHAAFIGLGAYGREVGRMLSKNWKSDNPISLHYLSSAFEANPLIELKHKIPSFFQGYGHRIKPSFSKFWKSHHGSIQALDSDIDPSTLQEILQGKELIFLACDELNEAWTMARSATLAVDPFLLITLHPTLNRESYQHALQSNESILQSPLSHAFPFHWDPVSTMFGSMVNPGLIGVDCADLKEVLAEKHGYLQLLDREVAYNLDGHLSYRNAVTRSAYIIIEHDYAEITIDKVHEIVEPFKGWFSKKYFAVALNPRNDATIITVCHA